MVQDTVSKTDERIHVAVRFRPSPLDIHYAHTRYGQQHNEKWGGVMNSQIDYKNWLLAKKEEAMARMQEAKREVEAFETVIASIEKGEPAPTPAPKGEVCSHIAELLRIEGQPIHRKAIWERLIEQGIYVNGKDPVASLGAILSKESDLFVSYGNGLWGLVEFKRMNDGGRKGNVLATIIESMAESAQEVSRPSSQSAFRNRYDGLVS